MSRISRNDLPLNGSRSKFEFRNRQFSSTRPLWPTRAPLFPPPTKKSSCKATKNPKSKPTNKTTRETSRVISNNNWLSVSFALIQIWNVSVESVFCESLSRSKITIARFFLSPFGQVETHFRRRPRRTIAEFTCEIAPTVNIHRHDPAVISVQLLPPAYCRPFMET